jgi:dTDP-4-amino-4,6-dideoxygalactose transaminase
LDNEDAWRRVYNYSDKFYDRLSGRELAQHHHGINYRMTELQGAVACAQLEVVDDITSRQNKLGDMLHAGLADMKGGHMMPSIDGTYSTYWWTLIAVHPDEVSVSRDQIMEALCAEGIAVSSYAKYDLIGKTLFTDRVARPWLDDDRKYFPFEQPDGRSYTYSLDDTPVHKEMLDTHIMVSMNARHSEQDMQDNIDGIRKVFNAYYTG